MAKQTWMNRAGDGPSTGARWNGWLARHPVWWAAFYSPVFLTFLGLTIGYDRWELVLAGTVVGGIGFYFAVPRRLAPILLAKRAAVAAATGGPAGAVDQRGPSGDSLPRPPG